MRVLSAIVGLLALGHSNGNGGLRGSTVSRGSDSIQRKLTGLSSNPADVITSAEAGCYNARSIFDGQTYPAGDTTLGVPYDTAQCQSHNQASLNMASYGLGSPASLIEVPQCDNDQLTSSAHMSSEISTYRSNSDCHNLQRQLFPKALSVTVSVFDNSNVHEATYSVTQAQAFVAQ